MDNAYKFFIILVLFIAAFFINLSFRPAFYIRDTTRECKIEPEGLEYKPFSKTRECICFGDLVSKAKKVQGGETKFYCKGFGVSFEMPKRENQKFDEIEDFQ